MAISRLTKNLPVIGRDIYFNGSQPEKGRCFVIMVSDRAIGQVDYNEINRADNSVELDIIIAVDTDKNEGYGSDALKTLAKYLFQMWVMMVERINMDYIEPARV